MLLYTYGAEKGELHMDGYFITIYGCPHLTQVEKIIYKLRVEGIEPWKVFEEAGKEKPKCQAVSGVVVNVDKLDTLYFGPNFVTIYKLTFNDRRTLFTSIYSEGF